MTLQRYYSDELTYLRDLGDEFARDNPNLAQFLSRQSNDPDVERLLEAFAFLTARLRQKLDDELPELSHSLVQVLWPQYLRPMPSCSIVEFTTAGPRVELPRSTILAARAIDGTQCSFKTSYDTTVLPLRVAELSTQAGSASGEIRLLIVNTAGQTCDRLAIDRLRLHFAAEREPLIARMLYQWVRMHLCGIRVEARGVETNLPPSVVRPVGFDDAEGLLPGDAKGFEGFRHIHEYFTYPDKFMFVDLRNLDCLTGAPVTQFSLTLQFDRPLPEQFRVTLQHIRLNCSPVVNVFAHDAIPLTVDHRRTDYRVRPESDKPDHFGIFSVDSAVGWARARNERTIYQRFETFHHARAGGGFFRVRIKPTVVRSQAETYISFVTANGATLAPPSETVSVALTCTNGRLAQHVPPGGIDRATGHTPAVITFRNIAAVSRETPPPIEGDLLWRLIANLSRNYGGIADLASLRIVIETYDFAAVTNKQARHRLDLLLDGLTASTTEPLDWMVRGIPVRGQRLRLGIVESKLGGEHEAYLFGCVLDSFFGSYAAINSCHQLVLDGDESKIRFAWPVRFGARSIL